MPPYEGIAHKGQCDEPLVHLHGMQQQVAEAVERNGFTSHLTEEPRPQQRQHDGLVHHEDPNALLLEDQVKLQAPELLAYVKMAEEHKELKYFTAVRPSRRVPDDWG